MKTKKIKRFEAVNIIDISAEGKAVGKVDNRVIFVEGAVPGDVCDIRVIGKKKKFLIAQPEKFHIKSPFRVEAFCKHFGVCGGCKWQHMDYPNQLKFKENQVLETLRRIGGLDIAEVAPIIGAEKTEFYRNKLEFSFSNKRWLTKEEIDSGAEFEPNALGFHVPKFFDKIVNIEECFLQEDPSNQIRNFIREYALKNEISFFDLRKQVGYLRNMFVRTSNEGRVMVILSVGYNDSKLLSSILGALLEKFPAIHSLYYTINEKKNDVIYDLDLVLYHGSEFLEEKLEGNTFKVGPKSFYQTNSFQAIELFNVVRAFSDLKKTDIVFDLYAGLGTIGMFLADQCKSVTCIESVPEAVELAKVNAKDNHIHNIDFYCGDMKDEIMNLSLPSPDVIICDPPRAGMHTKVVNRILEFGASKIVYVSCNVATQARDLEILSSDYTIEKIQPVDMFPHTHHIENVVLLQKKQG